MPPVASPFGKATVLANPRAGKGRVGRDPGALTASLDESGIEFGLLMTQGPGHATDLARRALEDGSRFLVAVGGDGTVHEVVNGMMQSGRAGQAVLGVVPAGSGGDFVKTFGLPARLQDAVRHLGGENTFAIDIGKITYTHMGERATGYFANIAEAGFGAEVVRRAEKLPRFVGRARYLVTFLFTLGAFRIRDARVEIDGRVHVGPLTNLVIANCQFYGGGMKIAPKALPDDGRFDVLLIRGTKRDYVANSTKVFRGEHLPSPVIKEYYAERVEVTADMPLRIEADGEMLGSTPATFEIIPSALRLKV